MGRKKKEVVLTDEEIEALKVHEDIVFEDCCKELLEDKIITEDSEEIFTELEEAELASFTMTLYLHDYVDDFSIVPIIKGIRKANNPFEMTFEETFAPDMGGQFVYKQFDKIVLHINSPGGSVDSGMALVNEILGSEVPIECIVTNAHSMAFLIAVVCHKRKIHKYGKMMWHDTIVSLRDKVTSIYECLDVLEKEEMLINEILTTHTKLKLKELKEIISKKQDRYYFAEEALAKGIVDEII